MKTLLMFIILTCSLLVNTVKAETWLSIGDTKEALVSVDVDSLNKIGSIAQFDMKLDYHDKVKNVDYAVGNIEINCNMSRIRATGLTVFQNGRAVEMEVSEKWEYLDKKDGISDKIENFVCHQKNKSY